MQFLIYVNNFKIKFCAYNYSVVLLGISFYLENPFKDKIYFYQIYKGAVANGRLFKKEKIILYLDFLDTLSEIFYKKDRFSKLLVAG